MSLLLSIILLAPTPFTASPDLGWQRVGKWGSSATRQARKSMDGIQESPSGRIRIRRASGPENSTILKLYPKTDGLVNVLVANGQAINAEFFISRKVDWKKIGAVVSAMRALLRV